jgi:tyrosine-protein phosphatase YwqE
VIQVERPFVDFHSHLMPGVDDGAQTLEDALDGVERMMAAGVGRIVTTPHFSGGLTRNPEALAARLRELDGAWTLLSDAVRGRWPDLVLGRGAEVRLDDPAVDLEDARLRLDGGTTVLVEWPGFRVPPRSAEMISALVESGVRPVIAHPERYGTRGSDLELMDSWKGAGALLQVNQGSFVGRYGKQVQRAAELVLESGMVDCICTDFHARPHYELSLPKARDRFRRAGQEDAFIHLAGTNPARILDGEDPIPLSPISLDVSAWRRVRGLFGGGTP